MKQLLLKGGGLLKSVALACVAGFALSSFAAFDKTNPVTGETETYTWKFTGTDAWNSTDVWADSEGHPPTGVPAKTDGNQWEPLLIDGNYTISTMNSWTIEGWNLRMGFYNGANVSLGKLNKLQGTTTMWITVDETSHFAVAAYEDGNFTDNQTLKFSVANANGITWNDAFAASQDNNTLEYYLKGAGSVSFQDLNAGTHKIKMADVTLTGTSQVSSKTLVSFTSTTKTFTADAVIKVYDTNGDEVETVNTATVNTTGSTTLTTDSAVGSCELVQTSTGIVLYYVDGDPSAIVAKTYQPSISVNFCHGNAPLTVAADVGVGDYAVPGTSWNNMISAGGNSGTFSTPLTTIYKIDSTGATSLISGASVSVFGTRGSWNKGNVSAGSDVRNGYIDDNDSNASPQFVVEGIPYYSYKTIIYFASDNNDTKFGYVTVNGVNYKGDLDNTATVAAEVGDIWGAASDTSFTEGGNYLVIPTQVNTDGTLTVVSHRLTGCRAGLAAVQIIEVPKTAEEGELVIDVSDDTTYTVSENATYTTVYVTGAGTLAFDGEGTITTTTLNVGPCATVPMGSSITPTTVTGAGTVVYDGAQPSTTLGFDDSANWLGTVWVKNIGSNGESSKVSTVLGTDTATATDNVLKDWGNENSSVKFTNVRGWTGTAVCPWTLILEDDSTNYAWYNNNGYAARSTTFAALKGSGTFYDKSVDNKPCRQKITFTDGSQFTGALYAEGKRVGLGGENTRGDAEDNNGTIEVVSGATATVASGKTWTAGTGSILVTGTLYANGTLAGTSTTRAVRGSGTVVFTGSAPSPTGDAWWKNSAWTGTVELNAATAIAGWEFNNYGHSGSTLRLNNCRGWLKANYTCIPALEIGGTFTWNDGSSGLGNTFKVGTLKGSGTISIPTGGAPTAVWQITDDWSGFTGAVVGNNTDGRRVLVFGSTLPATVEAGEIYVSDGATLNLGNASATWWTLGKGFVVDGTVVSPNRDKWGGGTAMTLGDTGVLELTSTANTQDYKDYSGVTGTGTIKYSSTAGWRLFPDTSAKMPATTLTIQTELADSLIIACTNDTVIGNLAGSKNIRSDWGENSANGRTLTVTQSKDTEWSGKFVSNRITQFNVNPGASTTGTLTLSGTQTVTVPAAINGSVNLTGTWVGATTVAGTFGGTGTLTGDLTFADGATFKAFTTDEDGLAVSGTVTCPEEGTVTVELAEVPVVDTVLIKASGLDADKFELASGTPGSLEVEDGALVYVTPYAAITVPNVANATVVVTAGGETIQPATAGGTLYGVTPGVTVTVTYTAAEGYSFDGAKSTFTLENVAGGESVDTSALEAKPYVAQVRNYGTNQNDSFTSLNAAIAVADGTTYANSITLLADITDAVTIDKAIYLAGQGKTISAAVTISSGGHLSLMGPTLTGKLTIDANGSFAVVGTGSVLPEVETQDGASIALNTLSADTVALTVTTLKVNGTLTLSSTAQDTVRGTPYKAFSYVTANATFGEGAEIVGAGVYSASTDVEGDNTVVSMTITAVAKIGDTYYDDLADAVADAIADDAIVELLVQPAATVTLGAGETLKVKAYSYTLTVALAQGLDTSRYSIITSLNTETTVTTYTVLDAGSGESGGIDPTTDGSTQTVTVDESLSEEEQEAAAIAAASVVVPSGVSGVDAATYKTYFAFSATPTGTAGEYEVAITGFADEVTETADGNALAALEAAQAGTALGSITVKPGLFYGTAAGADVSALKASAGTLNTAGSLDLSGVTKPASGEAYFIKIKVGTSAFAAEQ